MAELIYLIDAFVEHYTVVVQGTVFFVDVDNIEMLMTLLMWFLDAAALPEKFATLFETVILGEHCSC